MPNNISKSTLAKIINNNVSYIYPKTSIDNIVIDNDTMLNNKLDNIENRISVLEDNIPSSSGGEELKGLIERNLTSINIPSGVTTIGDCAFYYCTSLKSINIPSSVTRIGNNAFYYCSGLTSINIPSSVTSIGGYAFNSCTSLASINIPSSVTTISASAFAYCSGLTSVTIPSSVTTIDSSAFADCSGLTSVTIPSSVTSIGDHAFYNCSSLISINIPSSVTSIGYNAFYRCSGLTSVTLENGFNVNNLNLSASTKYSVETMVSWLNALYDRTGISGTVYKLNIGSTNLNKLTAEQKAIATNKNWTLA
jgi:hypothetical protein